MFGLLVAGCGAPTPDDRVAEAVKLAAQYNMTGIQFVTSTFLLQGYGTPEEKGSVLTVYIEGDGDAFDRYGVTLDPTPSDLFGLRLALRDSRRPLLYLGRPCQYIVERDSSRCMGPTAALHWSLARFSEPAIKALEEAIEEMRARTEAKRLVLIGYSGGGVMATLIAGRRYRRGHRDVDVLVTLAAPIDHHAWTKAHRVSALSGSESALTYLESLRAIPQIHFTGGLDSIVPYAVSRAYIDRLGENARVRHIYFQGRDHKLNWIETWPQLLNLVHAPSLP